MLDTTTDMQEKQLEIILSKSPSKRVEMGLNMIDFAYKAVKNSISIKNIDLTEKDLVIEIFKRFYKNDFSAEQLETIIRAIKKG